MRFSWTGLILAPLLPTIFCAAVLAFQENHWALAFLILMVPSCIISYCTMIFLFLPSLYLLSLGRPMTGLKIYLVGLVVGTLVIVPLAWVDWKSSGIDSGPPTEGFLAFFLRWAADPFIAIYPLAGLLAAGLYGWLVTRGRSRT